MNRLAALLTLAATSALAAGTPQPLPMPPAIASPRDVPYPGTLRLSVDATDLARHVFTVHETLDASPGDFVLLYPQWIPGSHGPTGPIELLDGLEFHAEGQRLAWHRDPVDMYAFHVQVPEGVTILHADFQFLSPTDESQGRVVVTPDMLDLQWNTVVLYPAGYFLRDIHAAASLHLPDGWQYGTALETSLAANNMADFSPEPLNVLFDSPLFAGRNFARFDLAPNGAAPVHLDVVADKPSELAATPDELAHHRAIIDQAARLFGSHHYDHYDFLLALSNELSGEGLEHHRSSENATKPDYFTKWDSSFAVRDLLTHEYTHSWNGKYKRPADLWAPNLNTPERDSLLWVYEGQTEYWGQVLAARAGLWTRVEALDSLAIIAAIQQCEVGRTWRPLADTTNDPIFLRRRPLPWISWQREEDYYLDGLLIWLDADTLIRERTHGSKSLDDFARAFFGTDDGSYGVSTYKFDDVVHALNAVLPYDWQQFLQARLDEASGNPPFDGLSRGGYRLVYNATPSAFAASYEHERGVHDFTCSIGITLKDRIVKSVAWNSPAWQAGLISGSTLLAVDGNSYTNPAELTDSIRDAGANHAAIDLLVLTGTHTRTIHLQNVPGPRYPHLVPIGTGPRTLDAILAAKP